MAALSTDDGVKKIAGGSTGTSPSKKSVIWDSLWSLDVSLDRGKK